jgi:hypothetical protein
MSLLFLNSFKPNSLIPLEGLSVVMFVTYNLPGDTLWKGVTASPFLAFPVKVLTFCTKRYNFHSIPFSVIASLFSSCSYLIIVFFLSKLSIVIDVVFFLTKKAVYDLSKLWIKY